MLSLCTALCVAALWIIPSSDGLPTYVPADLADATECIALGYADTTRYQNSVPLKKHGDSNYSGAVFLPVYASVPIGGGDPHPEIETAVIYIHGLGRNANTYYCTGAYASAPHGSSVLSIAPWFGDEQVTSSYWTNATDGGISAFWNTNNWMYGANNSPTPLRYTSSFNALDELISAISNPAAFPNMKNISVVGFSAGAQMTGRYAFATQVGGPPHVRFIVSNPSSYLYLSPARPSAGCSALEDTGPTHSCASFSTPEASACPGYDDYKFGLQNIAQAGMYFTRFDDAAVLAAAVNAFGEQCDFWLLLGDDDACNCNTPHFVNDAKCLHSGLTCAPNSDGGAGCCDTWPDATTSNALDVGCEASLQGSNRLQRGLNYAGALASLFKRTPNVATLPGVAHNNSGLYASAQFQALVFG